MKHYCFLFFFILSLVLPFSVSALSVSPTGIRLTVEPNTTEEVVLTLDNPDERAKTVSIRYVDEEGSPLPTTIQNWFESLPLIELPAGEQQDIRINFRVPIDSPPGDTYIYVVTTEVASGGEGFQIEPALGIPLTITVAGTIQEELLWEDAQLLRTGEKVASDLTLYNRGNIEVPFRGNVTFIVGDEIYSETALADTLRANQRVRIEEEITPSAWYIGQVLVRATVVYGVLEEEIRTEQRLFFVGRYVQWSIGGGIVLLLFFLIALIRHIRQKREYDV